MRLADALDQFYAYLKDEKNLSPMTLVSYNKDWNDIIEFLETQGMDIAALEVGNITKNVARNYLFSLNQRGLSRATINRRLAAMKSFFKFLLRKGFLEIDPIRDVAMGKLPKRLPHYLDSAEMVKVIEAPDVGTEAGLRDRTILEVLYGSGLRVSELTGLGLGDVHLSEGWAMISGKGGRQRVAPLSSFGVDFLNKYLSMTKTKRQNFGTQSVFLNLRGGPLTDRAVRDIVNKYCSQAHAKEILSPHGFRHSFATHLLDNGADLRVVQELLGHRRISSTQMYTHVSQTKLKKIYSATHPRAH
jgi:site-specific recombinase XerD